MIGQETTSELLKFILRKRLCRIDRPNELIRLGADLLTLFQRGWNIFQVRRALTATSRRRLFVDKDLVVINSRNGRALTLFGIVTPRVCFGRTSRWSARRPGRGSGRITGTGGCGIGVGRGVVQDSLRWIVDNADDRRGGSDRRSGRIRNSTKPLEKMFAKNCSPRAKFDFSFERGDTRSKEARTPVLDGVSHKLSSSAIPMLTPNLSQICRSAALLAAAIALIPTQTAEAADKPNIVFVMADDLGYGDLGCYGSELIQTPRLDAMAEQGIKFRNMYAGCTVCAPSRAVLMTGQHMGHTFVRGNAGGADMTTQTLRPEDVTVAEVLSAVGYRTALCGKWGLGDERLGGYAGLPTHQGFDFFYGYLNQVHAHNYYPEFLWRNRTREPLRNVVERSNNKYGGFVGGAATERIDYTHDLIMEEALNWLTENKDHPFFLYVPLTIPHANNEGTRMTGDGQEVPDYGPYTDRDWPNQDKGQAAMITRMDGDIGRLADHIKELGLAENTLILFTSDNGPHDEGGHNTERFIPAGPLRGMKRDLYEGGIREPFIAYWPGTSPAGVVSDHIGYFGDLMATAAELSGTQAPADIDSVSFAPTLTGNFAEQASHDYLYWEFYERGSKQAVRFGDWKAIRMPMHTGDIELYDLREDLGEANDIADAHPDIVAKAGAMMDEAHSPNSNWQPRGKAGKQPEPGDGRPRF